MSSNNCNDDLRFIPEVHEYWLGQRRLPSVTTVLPYDYPDGNKNLTLGRYVHQAIHYYNLGDLDEDSLDSDLMPYLSAYKEFRSYWKPKDENYIIDYKTGYPHPCTDLQLAAYYMLVREGYDENHNPIAGRSGEFYELRLYHPQLFYAGTVDYIKIVNSNAIYTVFTLYLKETGHFSLVPVPWDTIYKCMGFYLNILGHYKWCIENRIRMDRIYKK